MSSRDALVVLALSLGCAGPRPPARAPAAGPPAPGAAMTAPHDAGPRAHRWRVYDGDVAILELGDRPGPILSTAPLPPGTAPRTSPFMSATALDAGHEDRLHALLVASHSLDEFLRALAAEGYRLEPLP